MKSFEIRTREKLTNHEQRLKAVESGGGLNIITLTLEEYDRLVASGEIKNDYYYMVVESEV